jgi:hypothetical protein
MAKSIKLLNMLKKLDKPLLQKFFGFLLIIGISKTNAHGVVGQQVIYSLLAASVVFFTTIKQHQYFTIVRQ